VNDYVEGTNGCGVVDDEDGDHSKRFRARPSRN